MISFERINKPMFQLPHLEQRVQALGEPPHPLLTC
jgi:hypothetical protein